MTKKKILIGFLCISFFMLASIGRAQTVCTIIDNLRSQDEDLVEAACNKLGMDRGVIGLEKVQVLSPHSKNAARYFFIVGLSFEGPNAGYLVLIDKDGNVIDKTRVGYINQLTLISLKKEGDDYVLVDAIKGTGAGVRQDHYNIFSITNKGFLKLWEAVGSEISDLGSVSSNNIDETTTSVIFKDVDNDGILELIYQKKKVRYHYLPKTKQLKVGQESTKTEIYKLRKINNKQQFTLEKQKGK